MDKELTVFSALRLSKPQVPYGKVNEVTNSGDFEIDDHEPVIDVFPPVVQVMPYLIRRAQENSDALSGARKEIKMLGEEIRRRISPSLA